MNKHTLLHILVSADICCCLGRTSKKVQISDLFPWEYVSAIESMMSSLTIMKQYLDDLSASASEESAMEFVNILKTLPNICFHF